MWPNMPSPTDDQPGSPMAQLPPYRSPREPLKSYGQDYQYAEMLQNPYPEVVVSSLPSSAHGAHGAPPTSPVAAGAGGDGAQETRTVAVDHDAHSSHRPDTVGSKEPAMHEDVWVEPRDEPWYKAISLKQWATIIICTVGITGVVLAILAAMNKFSHSRSTPTTITDSGYQGTVTADWSSSTSSDPSSPTDNNNNSTSITTTPSTPTASSASSLPTGTTTTPKLNCADPTTYLPNTTWIGTEVGAYKGDFAQATSPESCCTSCQTHPGGGCAGWLYNATSTFTPCTKIIVTKDNHHDKDDSCPNGYAPATTFARGEGREDGGVAGLGPCGRGMQVS